MTREKEGVYRLAKPYNKKPDSTSRKRGVFIQKCQSLPPNLEMIVPVKDESEHPNTRLQEKKVSAPQPEKKKRE